VTVPFGQRPLGIALLGSTGSIGRQTLAVIDALPGRFHVTALAARAPSEQFFDQIYRYRPQFAAVSEGDRRQSGRAAPVAVGPTALIAAATHPAVDIVVVATSGHAAIEPTVRAIEHGKTIALANKETLVCAGEIIMPLARAYGVAIRPVDSEHSAIWQSLSGSPLDQVSRIILTASGGPFRQSPRRDLDAVTAEAALSHPTWSMGGKITIDSATLMNKGLEVIEAHWLFDLPFERIDVVIHPESIVHSLVEFIDGSQLAQLGLPDMRLPIQFALTYPDRVAFPGNRLDLATIGALHFEPPDDARFPLLSLARYAGTAGGTFPTVLSAADDVAVAAFLNGTIGFVDIASVVASALDRHRFSGAVTLETIAAADAWAREVAHEIIAGR
jgi:1-deoxy-D-xylulose-5-phosphate reductoisomerase